MYRFVLGEKLVELQYIFNKIGSKLKFHGTTAEWLSYQTLVWSSGLLIQRQFKSLHGSCESYIYLGNLFKTNKTQLIWS